MATANIAIPGTAVTSRALLSCVARTRTGLSKQRGGDMNRDSASGMLKGDDHRQIMAKHGGWGCWTAVLPGLLGPWPCLRKGGYLPMGRGIVCISPVTLWPLCVKTAGGW